MTPRKTVVLVVEDDPDVRHLYRLALIAGGYAVIAVGDGIDALRHIEGDAPSAIVLDLGLPLLGGRDVQRELASHLETQDIPIIVITGTDARDLDPANFACILSKPVSVDVLLSAVDSCLERAGVSTRTPQS